jgi:branched-subunit amino acid ABC-type transport system permease component
MSRFRNLQIWFSHGERCLAGAIYTVYMEHVFQFLLFAGLFVVWLIAVYFMMKRGWELQQQFYSWLFPNRNQIQTLFGSQPAAKKKNSR